MFYAYLMASRRNGTLYAGSTDSLMRRAWEHREAIRRGFTAKYGVHILVWYQAFETREGVKRKERQIKEWKRAWKLELIEKANPDWKDLYETLFQLSPEGNSESPI
ncbi:MAG: nuclease [Caulobacteraceae bacterium]|nr:nuclease [Caulobacteraceae bacterium]